jgi:hypothetical protein
MPSSKVPGLPIGVMGPSDIVPFQDPWGSDNSNKLPKFATFQPLLQPAQKQAMDAVCDSLERAKEHCTSVTSACAAIEVR